MLVGGRSWISGRRIARGVLVLLVAAPLLAGVGCGEDDAEASAIEVKGSDFVYEGLPPTLSAGTHTIAFENTGNEVHEVVIFRLPDGMTLEQVFEVPEQESEEILLAGLVGALFAQPGEAAAATLSAALTPGTYGLVCFIENGAGPHALQGMVAQLQVNP